MFVSSGNISELGVKGFNLYCCQLLDIPVPEFWIIPTDYYRHYLSGELAPNFFKKLKQQFSRNDYKLAVRSSCISEDLANKSNAGRFETVLNVDSYQKLIKAVKTVWNSANGNDMAVIIQKQVDPEISGVLFTRNPVNGKNETVIEYVEGLGDRLVSGKAAPKRVVIDNNLAINRTPDLKNHRQPLQKLIKTSKYLETQFGYPLDIEWAIIQDKLYILQARPITNLPVPKKGTDRTYSRIPAEQFYSGPVTPLFYSIFEHLYSNYYIRSTIETLGIDIDTDNILIKHKNHLYIDTTFTQALYSNLPIQNPEFLKVFPEDIREELLKKHKRINPGFLFKIFSFLLKNPQYMIWNLDNYFTEHVVPSIIRDLEYLTAFKAFDEHKLNTALKKLFKIANRHIQTSKWGLSLYIVPLLNALERLLERNNLDKNLMHTLISNLRLNRTLDASLELDKLGKQIREDPTICAIIQEEYPTYSEYRLKLETVPNGELIIDYFELILKKYGHRRLSGDIMEPSWNDEPMIPFSILRKMATEDNSETLKGRNSAHIKRKGLVQDLYHHLGFIDRIRLKNILKYLNRYIVFREFQRFYLDMIISKMRELVLEIANRMRSKGIIDEENDVFYLDILDLDNFLSGKKICNLKNIIEINKVTFLNEKSTPGKYLRAGVDFDSSRSSGIDNKEFSKKNSTLKTILGQPVSSGNFRGRARIIDNIDDKIKLEKNEILVTKSIDPGQTHAFLLAGGLILEVGGILSHGAILAREFNIPTVANVRSATSIFKEGQELVVDGSRGEIIVC